MQKSIVKLDLNPNIETTLGYKVRRFGDVAGTLGDVIHEAIRNKSYWFCREAANNAAWSMANAAHSLGFTHITGNLFASIGTAVISANPTKGRLTVSAFSPYSEGRHSGIKITRPGLAKGEVYDKPAYANGYPVYGNPYKAPTSYGAGQKGDDLRREFISSLKNTGYTGSEKLSTIYVFAAMPYASFVNMKKGDSNNFFQSRVMPMLYEAISRVNKEDIRYRRDVDDEDMFNPFNR